MNVILADYIFQYLYVLCITYLDDQLPTSFLYIPSRTGYLYFVTQTKCTIKILTVWPLRLCSFMYPSLTYVCSS